MEICDTCMCSEDICSCHDDDKHLVEAFYCENCGCLNTEDTVNTDGYCEDNDECQEAWAEFRDNSVAIIYANLNQLEPN